MHVFVDAHHPHPVAEAHELQEVKVEHAPHWDVPKPNTHEDEHVPPLIGPDEAPVIQTALSGHQPQF